MCECGCVANDRKYTLPGPGESYYLVTLRGNCVECCGESVVLIELLEPGTHDHEYYKDPDYIDGPLPLSKWSDSTGAKISVGMTIEEFQSKLSPHLVGLDSDEVGEDGILDDAAVETILEEMYEDAQKFPSISK